MLHPVDDDFDFGALVFDVENIFADAIVKGVCGIGPQCSVFGLPPRDWAFE